MHQKWPEGRKRLKTIITNFYCRTISIWNLILLYIVKVLNSATKVVNYCKSQPMLREVGCAVFPLCWYSTWFDKTKLVSCETSQCLQSHHINNLIRNKKFLNLNIDKNCFKIIVLQVSHAKFLRAKTVLRSYHHISRDMVEKDKQTEHEKREVQTLVGNFTLFKNLKIFIVIHFRSV